MLTNRTIILALYLNAILLLAIIIVLMNRNDAPRILPTAIAQNQLPIGGGAGVFLVPAQFSTNTFGCYLMDIDSQTLCAYQFMPGDKTLRLLAARNFRYDRRLGHFNTSNPTPQETKELVEKEQQSDRVLDHSTEKPPVEAPPQE